MSEPCDNPISAAKQLMMIEQAFGAVDFMPAAEVNPFPDFAPPPPPAPVSRRAVAAVQSMQPVVLKPVAPGLSLGKKTEMLGKLAAEVADCNRCILANTRTNVVFGEQNPDADLVFVGEAPGADEDATGRPFVGRAGELLTKMIGAMGLSRDQIYICNTLKCRPPGNRNPAPEETVACAEYLLRQLQIISPKVIVTLGNPATRGLLRTRAGITALRGTWQKLPDLAPGLAGIALMPTFHPSYLLRNYSVEARGKVWSDLQQVMAVLGLTPPAAPK